MPTPLLWLSGGIELVGGALVMVGFCAGWAAFLCSGLMAGAYFLVHQANGLLPIQNGGEPAALYSFVFLWIAVKGSGTWSIDASRGA
jgi:putative oxidoreductase